jgi:signal transduction histidine kinase
MATYSFKKIVFPLLAMIVAGCVGNYFGAPFFLGMEFLFGSIFAMLALQFWGYGSGSIAALVIATVSFSVRQQPFDVISLPLEVLAVGWLSRRKGFGFVVADALYWLCLGMPLSYLLQQWVFHFQTDIALITMFKQAINGISNALLARLVFMIMNSRSREFFFPLREVVFSMLAIFVLGPSLALMVYSHWEEVDELEQKVRQSLIQSSQSMEGNLESWLGQKSIRMAHLAWIAQHEFPALQHDLDFLRSLDPDLNAVGVIDKNAISTAFSPQRDELGLSTVGKDFSDRPYLQELKRTLTTQISEVVISKIGAPDPVAVLAAPIVVNGVYDGYAAAVLNLEHVRNVLFLQGISHGLWCTLLDKKNKVIVTNRGNLQVMDDFFNGTGIALPLHGGLIHWQPQALASSSWLERWQKSIYVMERDIGSLAEWRLIVEQPVAPFVEVFYRQYADQLELIVVVLLIALGIAEIISRRVLKSLVGLQEISSGLSEKLDSVHTILWPTSFIREVDKIIMSFKEMRSLLVQKFSEVNQLNLTLEQRVDERTKELADMTENLAAKVEEEIGRRRKNEQILIQQAKLAAMGEMLGAIAHQWRQPLNSLGLCIQNIKDSHSFGELSQDYLDRTVQDSMAQLNHMSRTIDDFRDFFRADKESSPFDVMLTVGEVLTLFSAQLTSHDIGFVLTCGTHQKTFSKVQDIVACSAKITLGCKNEFEHVILNLVNNARDAILERRQLGMMPPAEQGLIAFEFQGTEGVILIRVKDNGCGIPSQMRDRIFEPYFTTKGPDKGSGIGLYLSKIIIEDHLHGKLSVEECEQGASFVMVLPAVEAGLGAIENNEEL